MAVIMMAILAVAMNINMKMNINMNINMNMIMNKRMAMAMMIMIMTMIITKTLYQVENRRKSITTDKTTKTGTQPTKRQNKIRKHLRLPSSSLPLPPSPPGTAPSETLRPGAPTTPINIMVKQVCAAPSVTSLIPRAK